MKRQRQTELPRFVVGALATAGASVASGATVQIAFANNVLSTESGSSFTADLTGDLVADVKGFTAAFGGSVGAYLRKLDTNNLARALVYPNGPGFKRVAMVGTSSSFANGVGTTTFRGLVPFGFSESGVNGGQPTSGYLDVTSTAVKGGVVAQSASVQIHRLIFDDVSTVAPTGVSTGGTYNTWSASVAAVPEPSSSLALLALGAGGLLMRRRL